MVCGHTIFCEMNSAAIHSGILASNQKQANGYRNRSCHHIPASVINPTAMLPEALSGTQRFEDPLPDMCLGHNCRGTGKPAPFCMQKAALTPSLPQASSWQFRLWHSRVPPKHRQPSRSWRRGAQAGPFPGAGAGVPGTDTRSMGRDRAPGACRRIGDISCKENCSSVTSQIITSSACFFTLECLFCNQDIQVSASFWRIWSLSEITVQIKAFYSY